MERICRLRYKPDVVAERNINDIIKGVDTELKVALKEIRNQIK